MGGWTVSHGTCLPAGAIDEYAPFDLMTLTRERIPSVAEGEPGRILASRDRFRSVTGNAVQPL